jgi:catechol 2,3-dioxygenase-like lactoylglutathione lyase family enzyme
MVSEGLQSQATDQSPERTEGIPQPCLIEVLMAQLSYAVICVADMDRSIVFYRDILGLTVGHQSHKWTTFLTPRVTLALHRSDGPTNHTSGVSFAGQCQPGFTVEDIDAFHDRMLTKRVPCVQPPRDEGFGGKLALYSDPDGLVFSVTDKPNDTQRGQAGGSDNLARIAEAVENIAQHLDRKQSDQPALTGQAGMGNGQGSQPHRTSPYLDGQEAAHYLRITMQSLYDLVGRGHLVPFRGPRRMYRFTVEMLDDYIKRPSSEKLAPQIPCRQRGRKSRRA